MKNAIDDYNNNSEFQLGSQYGFPGLGFAFDLGFSSDFSKQIILKHVDLSLGKRKLV